MVVERQYINADRFVELVQQPQYDDCIVELVEGVIVEMPRPSAEHGEILMLLSRRLANYVYENKLDACLWGTQDLFSNRSWTARTLSED